MPFVRRALDKAAIKSDKHGASLTEVEETKAILGILPLFFWCDSTLGAHMHAHACSALGAATPLIIDKRNRHALVLAPDLARPASTHMPDLS